LHFSDKRYWDEIRKKNIQQCKKEISKSNVPEININQTINAIEELDTILNTLVKRVREWYGYYNPEFEKSIRNNDKFIELVIEKDIEDLKKEVDVKISMGGKIEKNDMEQIVSLANDIRTIMQRRRKLENYLEKLEKTICPNMQAVCGTTICAKLIEHAGTLKKLAMMPASTIQLLGAEKALFRHLKNKKSRCPKFGHIFNHQAVIGQKKSKQGKAARFLADKITIAARVDYFKGNFIGDELKKQIDNQKI
jgi:nucleolar protein 56